VSRQVDCSLVGSRKAGAGSIALRSVVRLLVARLWAASSVFSCSSCSGGDWQRLLQLLRVLHRGAMKRLAAEVEISPFAEPAGVVCGWFG
jgi:hypothetical protein